MAGYCAVSKGIELDSKKQLTPDDVASIVEHMNEDHSDAILLYVSAFTDVDIEDVDTATLTSVDHTGIDIQLTFADKVTGQRINYTDTGTVIEMDNRSKARAILVDMVKIARGRQT